MEIAKKRESTLLTITLEGELNTVTAPQLEAYHYGIAQLPRRGRGDYNMRRPFKHNGGRAHGRAGQA